MWLTILLTLLGWLLRWWLIGSKMFPKTAATVLWYLEENAATAKRHGVAPMKHDSVVARMHSDEDMKHRLGDPPNDDDKED